MSTTPNTTSSALLDPHVLAKISRTELVARQIMDGYVQGLHRAPHLGFAVDFAQHRQYTPGDDIKRIDWRAYAKADRLYIKQYEVSTTMRAVLVLDASGSMAYQGESDPISKFRYAQFLAACLAYLILHQQDSAGLVTFDSRIRQFIPPRATSSHLLTLCQQIDQTRCANESAIAPLLHEIAERLKQRGMVIVISDLLDKPDALIQALHHLRYRRHEVILMHTLADDELTFPFRQWSQFENLENPRHRLRLDPAMMRAVYMENLTHYLKTLRDATSRLNIRHVLLNTKTPFDDALLAFLADAKRKVLSSRS